MSTIRIQQWPQPVAAGRGTILDAALKAGIPYPYSCRVGECGECKSRLCAGEVALDAHAAQALTAAERATGLILACRTRPLGDVEVAWLGREATTGMQPVRRTRASVTDIERATHDIIRLRLRVRGEPLAFAAGQYAQLTFGKNLVRPYSMANRPGARDLVFHIRIVPDGVTSGYVARELQIGDGVGVEGPFGTAHLRDNTRPMLLVAGGSGLAPIESILITAIARGGRPAIRVYHGVRSAADLYDLDVVRDAAPSQLVRFTPVLSAPGGPTELRTGLVHEAVIADFSSLEGFDVYLGGPPPMVEAVTRVVLSLGAERANVHADAFHAAPPQAVGPARTRWLAPFAALLRRPPIEADLAHGGSRAGR